MSTETFAPVSDDSWPESLANLKGGFATRLNVYRTMAHHPALLQAWAQLRAHVVVNSTLSAGQSEVVILRTAHNRDSAYEWAHHVHRGRIAGLSDLRIESLRGAVSDMAPEDAVLARAVDALCRSGRLSPEGISELAEAIGRHGLVDLMATVGFYTTLGYIVESFQTPLDEDVAKDLAGDPLIRPTQ